MNTHSAQRGFSVIELGIIVVVVAVVGLLGWKFYDAQQAKKASVSNVADTPSVDMVPAELNELADVQAMQKDAIADKQGVTVIHVELEETTDGMLYKAELSDGTVTVYNARTGKRISSSTVAQKTSEALPVGTAPAISFSKALEIAKAEKPTSKVYKIELEEEGGVLVYSVRFSDKARVDVSAVDGSIVRTKAAKVEAKAETPAPAVQQRDDSKTETESEHETEGMTENDDDDATDSESDSGSHSGSSSTTETEDDHSGSGSNSGSGSSHN